VGVNVNVQCLHFNEAQSNYYSILPSIAYYLYLIYDSGEKLARFLPAVFRVSSPCRERFGGGAVQVRGHAATPEVTVTQTGFLHLSSTFPNLISDMRVKGPGPMERPSWRVARVLKGLTP